MSPKNTSSKSTSGSSSNVPVTSLRVHLSRNMVDKPYVSVRYKTYKFTNAKLEKEAGHISRNSMRRALAICRASRASIKAKTFVAATQIHEMEETLGMLRAKHALLQCREVDADEQIGRVRDALRQHGITEVSQSDDEDEIPGYSHTIYDDEAHYPPSSDLPSFDPSGSSESGSDSEEYPATTSQTSIGAAIAGEGENDAANHWDVCHEGGDGNRWDPDSHERHTAMLPPTLPTGWGENQKRPGPSKYGQCINSPK